MPNFGKFLICLAIEGVCIYVGLMVGDWWHIRDVPRDQIWAGDGIGIMLFGFIGAVVGAIVGGFGIALFLSVMRRTSHKRLQQDALSGEGVWPPPPSKPAAYQSLQGTRSAPLNSTVIPRSNASLPVWTLGEKI